tara:strand:+ start:354 stop:1148 length:795 start_codon:yes stop_codon:yes gene_type:complete
MSFVNNITSQLTPNPIDNLKGVFNKRMGPARPHMFAIFMQAPKASFINLDLEQIGGRILSGNELGVENLINDPRDLALICESCTIPGKQINTTEYSDYRQTIKLPNGYINNDVDFTFNLTNDYFIKHLFDKWINLVIPQKTYRLSYRTEYATDVIIQQLMSSQGRLTPVYGVRLKNAFPITMNDISLSHTETDSVAKLTVSMTYEDYVVEKPIQSIASQVEKTIPQPIKDVARGVITNTAQPTLERVFGAVGGTVSRFFGRLFN